MRTSIALAAWPPARPIAAVAALILGVSTPVACQRAPAPSSPPSSPVARALPADSAVLTILKERVAAGRNPGIVVGLLDASGPRVVAWGSSGRPGLPLDGRTLFEIGSITKVFTSALLMDMVARGEVTLDEPVERLLPATVVVPSSAGRKITLQDLASQVSGLPRMPSNFRSNDPLNPFADYTVAQLYEFLSGYTLPRAPGQTYEYSNLGAGLLGDALALKAGTSYEDAVRRRVIEPLGMADTRITLGASLQARFAQGHSPTGTPTSAWDFRTLGGAGALRSDADDMLKLLAANLAPSKGGLPAAFATMRQPRAAAGQGMAVGLGWHIASHMGHPIVWHNGGTGGYRSFAGYDTATGLGVVVLTNSGEGIDDIGFHLLDARYPLAHPAARTEQKEVAVDRQTLEQYVGVYELAPTFALTVTLGPEGLSAQATGQSRLRLYPKSATEFFYREVEASLTFERDASGQVTGLVLHQGGRNVPGKRRAAP